MLHRIIAKDGGRYLFRGDKNDFVDPERPEQSQLVGKLWIHVPGGGRYFAWITSAWTIGALAGIAALTLLGRTTSQRRQRRRKEPAVALSRPTLQNAVAGAAAALVLSLGFGVVAFSRAERHVVAAPVSYQASGSFSYTAGTALGDVYPRGRVATGDPFFFQLVHTLRVRFDYSFAAARAHRLQGTLGLVARLQASNGWTRTFPLAPPRPSPATASSACLTSTAFRA